MSHVFKRSLKTIYKLTVLHLVDRVMLACLEMLDTCHLFAGGMSDTFTHLQLQRHG